jgi:hypothetical protein
VAAPPCDNADVKARLLAITLAIAGCIPDHAPKVGRPTQDALSARTGAYLPQPGEDIRFPPSTRERTGTWQWPPLEDPSVVGAATPRAAPRRQSVALVLSGGGVRGAFQGGVITRMLTNPRYVSERRIDHIYGVSVGALNGLLAALAVSRVEAYGLDGEGPCPDCYLDEVEVWDKLREDGKLPRYSLDSLGKWTLWRVWAGMADYKWFQRKRSLVDFVIDGYLFDLRTLRLRLDQLVGDGDTLFLRARPTTQGFAYACREATLHWPILHVGYVPYSTGVYRSVAYDPRREAEAACYQPASRKDNSDLASGERRGSAGGRTMPRAMSTLDLRTERQEALTACRARARGSKAAPPAYPLSCELLTWLEQTCPPPEDGPDSCSFEGSDVCCTDDVDAFKDATWASTAQPLLHNPVPVDPTVEGYRLRTDDDYLSGSGRRATDPTAARAKQASTRAKLWKGNVNRRSGLENHYPDFSRTQRWQDRDAVPGPRARIYRRVPEDWRIEAGELEWAVDGGVREVFPLMEALATGVDEIIVIGNVPARRPLCEDRFAEEMPGPAARTYNIMLRSILEEMISEIYNDDLLLARQFLQGVGRWNREKAWLVELLVTRIQESGADIGLVTAVDKPTTALPSPTPPTPPVPEPRVSADIEPDLAPTRHLLAPALEAIAGVAPPTLHLPPQALVEQIAMLAGPCAAQTISDTRLMELVAGWLECDGADAAVCERAAELGAPPRIGFEDWRNYPAAMHRLRAVQGDDLAACMARSLDGLRPGYYRVPDVFVALPDRYPGDPLDQVHEDMMMLMRDGFHRADRMVPLLDYTPPDRCVSDPICSSCGGGSE